MHAFSMEIHWETILKTKFRLFFGSILASCAVQAFAAPSVVGNIDGYFMQGTQLTMSGWACTQTSPQPIDVHVYAGGPYGSGGTLVAYGTANFSSEPAVASSCQSYGTTYRFRIVLSPQVMQTWGSKPLYVHGINNLGGANSLLGGSGYFRVPHRVATLLGARGDGYTDDTNALQAAISQGGLTYIPNTGSAYMISGPLKLGSNTEVMLDGKLMLKPGLQTAYDGEWYNPITRRNEPRATQWGMLQVVNNASNVTISGRGVLDGNRAAYSRIANNGLGRGGNPNFREQTICCVGGVVTGGPHLGSYDANIKNVVIRDITIQNIPTWPIIDAAPF
ncbi:MAG TPA: glycosyl hydrolase family 28-related protein [Paucimonas sp.]|nr:glycosyl hydrolase family 28-related protein [Paucimonas sp.]